MSSELPASDSSAARPPLRIWHWLLFFIPSVVCIGLTFGLAAMERAKDEASGFTQLSDYGRDHMILYTGISGAVAGAVACLVCGVVIGLTSGAGNRWLACLGWIAACTLVNLLISYAGCAAMGD